MKWASSSCEGESLSLAIEKLAGDIRAQMAGHPIHLAFLFVTPHYQKGYDLLSASLVQSLPCETLIGCSAGGIIGGQKEIEGHPAMTLLAAHLPGVHCQPFHLDTADLPDIHDDIDATAKAWETMLQVKAGDDPHFILLGDPLSFDMEKGLMGFDFTYPKATKIGGLASGTATASGAATARQNTLFVNATASGATTTYHSGMVGVALHGNLQIDTLVAQGCRPIGPLLSITRCHQNLLMEIDHQTPLSFIQTLFEQCDEVDRKLMQHSLFMGLVIDPFKDEPTRGDFLIRNLIGMDPKNGYLAIGALLREGQTIQFHLRDATAAREDLQWQLMTHQLQEHPTPARGALLFSCLGRGEHLFGEPNHDSNLFHRHLGPLPLGGFFCNGEIGGIGGATFLHGYTSCFGIFREKGPSS